ncbi:MAG: AraC family transcriptional regulator [Sphingomonadales bacterium]|nr:MAG: AraC family transcriptional regulator [Sphingomonadales bacterium]
MPYSFNLTAWDRSLTAGSHLSMTKRMLRHGLGPSTKGRRGACTNMQATTSRCSCEISFPRLGWKLRPANSGHQLSRTDDCLSSRARPLARWGRESSQMQHVGRGVTSVETGYFCTILLLLRVQMEPGEQLSAALPNHTSGSYRAWELSGMASGIVDLAWHSRVEHASPEAHRLLPFSEPSLAMVRRFDRVGQTQDIRFTLFCARPNGGHYCPEPGEEIFGLRLAPEVMETAIGLRAAEIIDADIDLPAQLARSFDQVRARADRSDFNGAWSEMFRTLVQSADKGEMDRLGYAGALSRKAAGRISPRELAEKADISPRHLRRGFAERFGLSPRGWVRRLRLTAALLEAESQERPDWAGIAAGNRFADQAHLIRECRAILGESPGMIHALRQPMAVSFNN